MVLTAKKNKFIYGEHIYTYIYIYIWKDRERTFSKRFVLRPLQKCFHFPGTVTDCSLYHFGIEMTCRCQRGARHLNPKVTQATICDCPWEVKTTLIIYVYIYSPYISIHIVDLNK